MKPTQYYRANKNWSEWLGKTGTVIATTYVQVASSAQSAFTPYSYVLVDFGTAKHEFMGVGHDQFSVGQKVKCVLRKIGVSDQKNIIEYGIKVAPVT